MPRARKKFGKSGRFKYKRFKYNDEYDVARYLNEESEDGWEVHTFRLHEGNPYILLERREGEAHTLGEGIFKDEGLISGGED